MKLEIKIPKSINDIALGDFQAYMLTEQNDSDKLRHLMKLTDATIRGIKKSDFDELVEVCNKILSEEIEFEQFVKIGKTTYGFIPNMEEMTQGEFTDIDENVNDIQTLHTACAVMYRPIIGEIVKGKYQILPYNPEFGFDELMKNMPTGVALGIKIFFYALGRELAKITPDYLVEEVKEMATQQVNNLVKNGAGTSA